MLLQADQPTRFQYSHQIKFNIISFHCLFSGAFLIPYIIFMFTMAMPMMFVEFSIAQYSNLGPAKVWLCCPLFKGKYFILIFELYVQVDMYL